MIAKFSEFMLGRERGHSHLSVESVRPPLKPVLTPKVTYRPDLPSSIRRNNGLHQCFHCKSPFSRRHSCLHHYCRSLYSKARPSSSQDSHPDRRARALHVFLRTALISDPESLVRKNAALLQVRASCKFEASSSFEKTRRPRE